MLLISYQFFKLLYIAASQDFEDAFYISFLLRVVLKAAENTPN